MSDKDFHIEVIERLTRIEENTKDINLRLCKLEDKVEDHDKMINLMKTIGTGTKWWLQAINSGIGVLIGAILVAIFSKSCI
jgi:hypothetical protein